MDGMANIGVNGVKTVANALLSLDGFGSERAMRGFAALMTHVCRLYTLGGSSSVSQQEGYDLAESVLYVLGFFGEEPEVAVSLLESEDVVGAWTERRKLLEARIPEVMSLWRQVVVTMPPFRNIALRDTLASIERLPSCYDTFFGAHQVPCSIDYPLSAPVSEELRGLDYVEAWLAQLLEEARILARFDLDDMVEHLESWCPDYRGLLINLYEPIRDLGRSHGISAREP